NLKQMRLGEEKIFYDEIEELWPSLRSKSAILLNGEPEGVTITTNTASGLHIVADCLYNKFSAGKNIVMPDVEFVTNSYCWQQVVRRYGLELRTINNTSEEEYYEQFNTKIDSNTVLVVLSHVQFSNGFKSDLERIAQIAHNHSALVCVDAIQSLGAVPFDVKKYDVDFVAAASYKFMLGPQGSGILYIKPELVEELESIMVGWFSTPNYQTLSHNSFVPWNDARKFQQSMINPVLNAFNESLHQIISWDVEKTYSSIIKLQNRLIDGIQDHSDFHVESSLEPNTRSGIIKIGCTNNAKEIVDYLGKEKITVSYRDGGIRVSPHAYNDFDDIDKLVDVLTSWNFK
ncbi:MAG: aminotransferase class V-fold PLP-dependent enzyme, partial [Candidatus Kariarchaeaceae archaeon]